MKNDNPPISELADKLREARRVLGLSQNQAAYEWGFSVKTLEAWESGHRKPPRYAEILLLEKLTSLISANETSRNDNRRTSRVQNTPP